MRKSDARNRILETAARLFHERGFSEVGINEIIAKAETAKATFYQHFPSKQTLCEAWLDFVHNRGQEKCREVLQQPGTGIEKVERYFSSMESYMIESDFRGCPYSNTGAVVSEACCGIRGKIEEHKLALRDFFRTLAQEIASSGQGAQALGDTLFLLYSGAATEAQNLRALWPIQAAKTAALATCERFSAVTIP